MLKLAASLEKKEDLIGALEQYRLAAETRREDKARAQYAAGPETHQCSYPVVES
jgi:hypothetical protein